MPGKETGVIFLLPTIACLPVTGAWQVNMSYGECFSCIAECMHDKSLHLCPTLCDSTDCSPPGSSVHRILQARILEWDAMPSSRGNFPIQGIEPASLKSALAGEFFTTSAPWEALVLLGFMKIFINLYITSSFLQIQDQVRQQDS